VPPMRGAWTSSRICEVHRPWLSKGSAIKGVEDERAAPVHAKKGRSGGGGEFLAAGCEMAGCRLPIETCILQAMVT